MNKITRYFSAALVKFGRGFAQSLTRCLLAGAALCCLLPWRAVAQGTPAFTPTTPYFTSYAVDRTSATLQFPAGVMVATYNGAGVANSSDYAHGCNGQDHCHYIRYAQVYLIFWGSAWATAANPSTSDVISKFTAVMNSQYFADMPQYGFANITPVLNTVDWGNPPPFVSWLDTQNEIWAMIHRQSPDGPNFNLPYPDAYNQDIFVLVLPPGVSLASGYQGEHHDYPVDNVGYWFGTTDGHAYVATIKYGNIDSMTALFGHELNETISDPAGASTYWNTNPKDWVMNRSFGTGNEIGDACQATSDRLDGLLVQPYWSQALRACAIPVADALTISGTALTGYFDSNTGSQNLFYIGDDQHVHQMARSLSSGDSSWTHTDPFATVTLPVCTTDPDTGAQSCDPPTPIVNDTTQPVFGPTALSSIFDPTIGSRVFYIASDKHVHDLVFTPDGVNSTNDLNADPSALPVFTGIPQTSPGTNFPGIAPSAALASVFDGTFEHVVYVDSSQHLRELVDINGDSGPWATHDLTAGSFFGTHSLPGQTQLTAYWDGSAVHLFFIDNQSRIHEYLGTIPNPDDPTTWDWFDTVLTPIAPGTDTLTSYWDVDNKVGHVFYIGNDSHLREMYCCDFNASPSGWVFSDVTTTSRDPLDGTVNPTMLSSFYDSGNHRGRVFLNDLQGNLHRFTQTGQWRSFFVLHPPHSVSTYKNVWAPADVFTGTAAMHSRLQTSFFDPLASDDFVVYLGGNSRIIALDMNSLGTQDVTANATDPQGGGIPNPIP